MVLTVKLRAWEMGNLIFRRWTLTILFLHLTLDLVLKFVNLGLCAFSYITA